MSCLVCTTCQAPWSVPWRGPSLSCDQTQFNSKRGEREYRSWRVLGGYFFLVATPIHAAATCLDSMLPSNATSSFSSPYASNHLLQPTRRQHAPLLRIVGGPLFSGHLSTELNQTPFSKPYTVALFGQTFRETVFWIFQHSVFEVRGIHLSPIQHSIVFNLNHTTTL